MRLLNGDPEQQRSKEAAKENYKRQLALQMQNNLKRRQQEKQKERELEEKYERAFYEQRRQLEQQQTEGQSKSPATQNNPNVGGQRNNNNRSVSEKHIGSPDRLPTLKDRQAQRQSEYIDGLLGHKDSLPDQQAPNLLMKRQAQSQQSSYTGSQTKQTTALMLLAPDPAYQQQRLYSIQQFQESILKKVDELKFDIGRAGTNNLEVNREVDRIRGLLRNKDVLQYDASSLMGSQVRERFHSDNLPSKNIQSRARRHLQQEYSPSLQNSNVSGGGYRQLDALTEVRYPEKQSLSDPAPVTVPSTFNRIPQIKSESSEAEDEQYDKVEVPDLPSRVNKQSTSQGLSKFAPQRSSAIRDISFDRAKFVPKAEILDYKVENYLTNIQNLIQHYKD